MLVVESGNPFLGDCHILISILTSYELCPIKLHFDFFGICYTFIIYIYLPENAGICGSSVFAGIGPMWITRDKIAAIFYIYNSVATFCLSCFVDAGHEILRLLKRNKHKNCTSWLIVNNSRTYSLYFSRIFFADCPFGFFI